MAARKFDVPVPAGGFPARRRCGACHRGHRTTRPRRGGGAAYLTRCPYCRAAVPLCDYRRALVASCHALLWSRVHAAARRRPGADPEALYDAALAGLVRAAGAYDPASGYKFVTLAQVAIDHDLAKAGGRRPEVLAADLAGRGGDDDDDGAGLLDRAAAPADRGPHPDDVAAAAAALARLTPRERDVLRLRHYAGWTLGRVAADLGVSKERARQIQRTAEEKVRAAAGEGGGA